MRILRRFLVLAMPLVIACGGDEEEGPRCEPTSKAVVTDIDETLTTLDSEWLTQVSDPAYDPAMRPDASTMMQTYAELGYTVFYITARGQGMTLPDGRSSTEATEDWLSDHDFPLEKGSLYLAEGIGALGDMAVDYKSAVIADLEADGMQMAWAYGNADTDIEAFQLALIPDDQIFLVGVLAGEMGVEPILDADAYTNHLADHVGGLDCAEP